MSRENAGYANTIVEMVKDWKSIVITAQTQMNFHTTQENDYAMAELCELRNRMNAFILSVEGKHTLSKDCWCNPEIKPVPSKKSTTERIDTSIEKSLHQGHKYHHIAGVDFNRCEEKTNCQNCSDEQKRQCERELDNR